MSGSGSPNYEGPPPHGHPHKPLPMPPMARQPTNGGQAVPFQMPPPLSPTVAVGVAPSPPSMSPMPLTVPVAVAVPVSPPSLESPASFSPPPLVVRGASQGGPGPGPGPLQRVASTGSRSSLSLSSLDHLGTAPLQEQFAQMARRERVRVELALYWAWIKLDNDLLGMVFARKRHKLTRRKRVFLLIMNVTMLFMVSTLVAGSRDGCLAQKECHDACVEAANKAKCSVLVELDVEQRSGQYYVWPHGVPLASECNGECLPRQAGYACPYTTSCAGVAFIMLSAFMTAVFVTPVVILSHKVYTCYWCNSKSVRRASRRTASVCLGTVALMFLIIGCIMLSTLDDPSAVLLSFAISWVLGEVRAILTGIAGYCLPRVGPFGGVRKSLIQAQNFRNEIEKRFDRPRHLQDQETQNALARKDMEIAERQSMGSMTQMARMPHQSM